MGAAVRLTTADFPPPDSFTIRGRVDRKKREKGEKKVGFPDPPAT